MSTPLGGIKGYFPAQTDASRFGRLSPVPRFLRRKERAEVPTLQEHQRNAFPRRKRTAEVASLEMQLADRQAVSTAAKEGAKWQRTRT